MGTFAAIGLDIVSVGNARLLNPEGPHANSQFPETYSGRLDRVLFLELHGGADPINGCGARAMELGGTGRLGQLEPACGDTDQCFKREDAGEEVGVYYAGRCECDPNGEWRGRIFS